MAQQNLPCTPSKRSLPSSPPSFPPPKRCPPLPPNLALLLSKVARPSCPNLPHKTLGTPQEQVPLTGHVAHSFTIKCPLIDSDSSEACKSLDSSCLNVEAAQLSCETPTSIQVAPSLPRRKKFTISNYRPPGLVVGRTPMSSPSRNSDSLLLSEKNVCGNKDKSHDTQLAGKVISIQVQPSTIGFYSVMYCARKRFAKRKGPWSDGVLVVRGRKCTLQDIEGKIITKADRNGTSDFSVDATIEIGKFELQVMRVASQEDYDSGTLFTGCFVSPSNLVDDNDESFRRRKVVRNLNSRRAGIPLASQQTSSKDVLILSALNDVNVSMPIIVDPYVASRLRPHQREGVKFMYECVMGLKNPSYTGCLLADEMGLGKTLQVIALIWTLIQQGMKIFKHIIVVCPSSLVQNWANEVRKWLGPERLKALALHGGLVKEAEQKFLDFKNGKQYPLLITSYELLRKHQDILASSMPGLLVCDEAHRLKNCAGNKTIDALLALNCSRRILLTGTPIQNDLNEFYAMIDFANPNLLGSLSAFKRLYAEPIEFSKDLNASEDQRQLGQSRFLELQTRSKFCVLRRTAAVIKTHLPTKSEYLVFCRLQPLQVSLYEAFLRSKLVAKLFLSETSSASVLTAIGILRKLCNHPGLVLDDMSREDLATGLQNCSSLLGSSCGLSTEGSHNKAWISARFDKSLSGKLECLHALLSATFTHDPPSSMSRVVVVSNFTQTLNIVQALCDKEGWTWLRLDGATNVADRQQLVDRFNSGFNRERVFLLSAKAGGMGLNLIGANRLILFDPDWNPATDAQAMARIWREGQKNPVMIYRLLSTGSIEEKIYQRQMVKGEIATTVEEKFETKPGSNSGRYFSREELRELFELHLDTSCDTFDLLSCRDLPAEEQWKHCLDDVDDPALKEAIGKGQVSFVHKKLPLPV